MIPKVPIGLAVRLDAHFQSLVKVATGLNVVEFQHRDDLGNIQFPLSYFRTCASTFGPLIYCSRSHIN